MFEKKIKKMDIYDIAFIKMAVASGMLFIITVWPAAMDLVHKIHWGWFLGAWIIFAAKPGYKFFVKK